MSLMSESLLELKYLLELINLIEEKNDERLDKVLDELYGEFEFVLNWQEKIKKHCDFCKCTNAPPSRLDSMLQRKNRVVSTEKRELLRKGSR
jgi:hypothetical protein